MACEFTIDFKHIQLISNRLGVAKPSGMTSMAVVEQMQSLFVDSPLFVEPQVLDKQRGMKKQKKRKGGGPVKMGQGGTLDPLADGVLGIKPIVLIFVY